MSYGTRKSYLLMFFKEQIDFRLFEYLQVKVLVYHYSYSKVFQERIVLYFCSP